MTPIQFLTRSAIVLAILTGINAFASEWKPYNEHALAQAQSESKTVVLDFHAPWCSTCKKQRPILDGLLNQKEFENIVGFTVDFDNAAALKKKLKVQKQSTLIVFKGHKEVARDLGLVNKDQIESLFMKGI